MNQNLGRAFCLLLLCLPLSTLASADAVWEVALERAELFSQCTSSRPDTTLAHHQSLTAWAFPVANGEIYSASLTLPGGASMELSNYNGQSFSFSFPLDTSAPAGAYAFRFDTFHGPQQVRASLPGPANGIRPLRIANFAAAQQADATRDFQLLWDQAPKLNRYDRLYFRILDTNGTTVFAQSQLDLSTTGALIPAGTLQPNTTYYADLALRHYFKVPTGRPPYFLTSELRETRATLKTLNPAGVFQFADQPPVVHETDGLATVTVERTQGSSQDASVDYFCADASAHSNQNYLAVFGTLVFPAGVTTQTIQVPLLDDQVASPPLYLRLTLTNATGGAGLIVRPHTTVTILDAGIEPGGSASACLLGRVRFYSQTSTNLPTQSSLCDAARFYASIHLNFPGAASNAVVFPPKGPALPLNYQDSTYDPDANFPSMAALNKAFPGGAYKFSFDTLSEGSFAFKLTLGAERTVPVPHLSNWQDLQAADPSVPITLYWDTFQGATSNDYVRVSVRDAANEYVVRTSAELEPGALPGSTNSFTIPAGTLAYGQAYAVDLSFSKVTEAKQVYPGLRNGMTSARTTTCYLHTLSAPNVAGAIPVRQTEPPCPCQTSP